jgi:HAD superfamily 5'-nucleotidase-like hydrolase
MQAETDVPEAFSIVREGDACVDTFGQSTYGDLHHSASATPLGPDEVESLLARILPAFTTLPTGESTPPLDTATRGDRGHEPRGVYCSRTLNMRSIKCIGFDMDYSLVQYNVANWEAAAYRYAKQALARLGFPVDSLTFTDELVVRGCIVDKRLGNFVHADRFGYVRRAMHGTRRLSRQEVHSIYGRQEVDLRNTGRWEFMNTLFSISEGCLYAQLVDKLDDGSLFTEAKPPFVESRCATYEQLHAACSRALFHAHVNSALKADVLANPDHFVRRDPSLPLTLMDQKYAGKKLVLITNSDWSYTSPMMSYICNEFLPEGMTWRDLFDVVIVSARKPAFFAESMPLYEIVNHESGMMLERFKLETGKVRPRARACAHCESPALPAHSARARERRPSPPPRASARLLR